MLAEIEQALIHFFKLGMYTFLACGEELHAPDSYSIELHDCCTGP